jgi:hypothetical protein
MPMENVAFAHQVVLGAMEPQRTKSARAITALDLSAALKRWTVTLRPAKTLSRLERKVHAHG